MKSRSLLCPALLGLFVVGGVAAEAPARAPRLVALRGVQSGQWELHQRGNPNGPARLMCVQEPADLFIIRHRGIACTRVVIDNAEHAATVHYTCPGAGHGRTTVTAETPRLLQIDTQGIAAGRPFAEMYEARHTGACSAGAARRRRGGVAG